MRPKGARSKKPLHEVAVGVLAKAGKPLPPKEIAEEIKKAGYKSKSSNLPAMISGALAGPKEVKKIGFGKYAPIS